MHFLRIDKLALSHVVNKEIAILRAYRNSGPLVRLQRQISQRMPLSDSTGLNLNEHFEVVFGFADYDALVVWAAHEYLAEIFVHEFPVDWGCGEVVAFQVGDVL